MIRVLKAIAAPFVDPRVGIVVGTLAMSYAAPSVSLAHVVIMVGGFVLFTLGFINCEPKSEVAS